MNATETVAESGPVSTPTTGAEPRRLKVAVVGRHVPAMQLLLALRAEAPRHDYHWLQTAKDARMATNGAPLYTLISNGVDPTFAAERYAIPIRSCPLILEGHRRVRLEDLASGSFRGVSSLYPEPIVRKILGLGLWGDLTPDLWLRDGSRFVPNTAWVQSGSDSAAHWETLKDMAIVPRHELLERLASSARASGIYVEQEHKWVLGLQVGKNAQPNQLVLNAPNPALEVDRVVWLSQIDGVNEESQKTSPSLRAIDREPWGSWSGWGAWVDLKQITALPPFSLWLDPARENFFLSTGMHASGLLRRVYAVPARAFPNDTGTGPALPPAAKAMSVPVWLQVEELQLGERAWVPEFLRERVPAPERADSFLWKICPLLRKATLDVVELPRIDEGLFYGRPRGESRDLGHGVVDVSAGKLPLDKGFVKQVLTQLKIAMS